MITPLSSLSHTKLSTCHPLLIGLVNAVAAKTSIAVICGARNQADQDVAFATKKSRLQWPNSRHNSTPSEAVDLVPLPLDWDDIASFTTMAQVVKDTAAALSIQIEWGGDWTTFKDFDHFQLKAGTF
jgi:peptidoglycan L-alanyl-D-glutamate endopeptidase CwlK